MSKSLSLDPIKIFMLFAIATLYIRCGEDPADPTCQNYALNFGPFYLEENTRNVYPYSRTDKRLVFKNALVEELVFDLEYFYSDTSTFSYQGECPFDSNLDVPYVRTEEQMRAIFMNDSLEIRMQLDFRATFDYELDVITGESDMANLFFSEYAPGINEYISSVIVHKSGQIPSTSNLYHQTITLGAKTFENVYSNIFHPQFMPEYIVYMNYDIGIVGFEETATGNVWAFDRIE